MPTGPREPLRAIRSSTYYGRVLLGDAVETTQRHTHMHSFYWEPIRLHALMHSCGHVKHTQREREREGQRETESDR